MKITFRKGMSAKWAMYILEKFLCEEAEEYPILKDTMTVNIDLKGDWGDCINNNETIDFNLETIKEYDYRAKALADAELEEDWEHYVSYYNCDKLKKHIHNDYNYIKTAEEKNRKPENIETRKVIIKKREKYLQKEVQKMNDIIPFIKLKNEGNVWYEYRLIGFNDYMKIMIFEYNNKIFEFCGEYIDDIHVIGSGTLLEIKD